MATSADDDPAVLCSDESRTGSNCRKRARSTAEAWLGVLEDEIAQTLARFGTPLNPTTEQAYTYIACNGPSLKRNTELSFTETCHRYGITCYGDPKFYEVVVRKDDSWKVYDMVDDFPWKAPDLPKGGHGNRGRCRALGHLKMKHYPNADSVPITLGVMNPYGGEGPTVQADGGGVYDLELRSGDAWWMAKYYPENVEERARNCIAQVGPGMAFIEKTAHKGCLYCLDAHTIEQAEGLVPIWVPMLPCYYCSQDRWWMKYMTSFLSISKKVTGVFSGLFTLLATFGHFLPLILKEGRILEALAERTIGKIPFNIDLCETGVTGCLDTHLWLPCAYLNTGIYTFFFGTHYLWRRYLVRRRLARTWSVIYVQPDLIKKDQVLEIKNLSSSTKTIFAESVGTHGKFLEDLNNQHMFVRTSGAVVALLIGAYLAVDPQLVRPAKPTAEKDVVRALGDEPEGGTSAEPEPERTPTHTVVYSRPIQRVNQPTTTQAPSGDAGAAEPLVEPMEAAGGLGLDEEIAVEHRSSDALPVRPIVTEVEMVQMGRGLIEAPPHGAVLLHPPTSPALEAPTYPAPRAPEDPSLGITQNPPPRTSSATADTSATDNTDFYPDGMNHMGYMIPDASFDNLAEDVKAGMLETTNPIADASKIFAREQQIERLQTIATIAQLDSHIEMIEQKLRPQFRITGPCKPSTLPKVAGAHHSCIIAGMSTRHFAKDDVAGVIDPAMVELIQEHVQLFLDLVKTGMAVTPLACQLEANKKMSKTSPQNAADMTYLDWGDMMSKSWDRESGWRELERVFCACVGIDNKVRTKAELKKLRKLKRTFFVKLNEALAKIKPRLIQSSGREGAATHIPDAGVLEKIIFGLTFLEMRSIKHASPKQLRVRFATFMERFLDGYAMSGDFGKFDSSLKRDMRELVENTVVWALLAQENPGSQVMDRALADRLKEQLNSMSSHVWLSTKNAGRESGDRGTSILNYITNLIIFTVSIACEYEHRAKCEGLSSHDARMRGRNAVKEWYEGGDMPFDWMGEGDDNGHLYTAEYVESAPGDTLAEKRTGIVTRLVENARLMGMYLEPQDRSGAAPLAQALVPVRQRFEFTSKVIKPYYPMLPRKSTPDASSEPAQDAKGGKKGKGKGKKGGGKGAKERNPTLFVAILPKVKKTLDGSRVTFCTAPEIPHECAGFMKYLSMMHTCIDSPVMFEYAHMFARHYARIGGTSNLRALTSYDSQRLIDCYGEDASQWGAEICRLHSGVINVDGHTTAMQQAFTGEEPLVTGDLQEAAVTCFQCADGSFDELVLLAQDKLLQYIYM